MNLNFIKPHFSPPSEGFHKTLPGIQEGGPHRRPPHVQRSLPAPTHTEVELVWKSADEHCQLRTRLI